MVEPPVEPFVDPRRFVAVEAAAAATAAAAAVAMCLLIGSLKVVDEVVDWLAAAVERAFWALVSDPVGAVAFVHLDSPEPCCDGAEWCTTRFGLMRNERGIARPVRGDLDRQIG